VPSLWFDGYDRGGLAKYPSLYANASFLVQHVPFEAAAAYPHEFPGLNTYISTMEADAPSATYSEVAMEGWLSAALFVNGLQKAGRDLTQAKLISATNALTAFTGGGLTQPVNWKTAHTRNTSPECEAFDSVSGGHFEMTLNEGTDPWVCFPLGSSVNLNKRVPPPPGSPGL